MQKRASVGGFDIEILYEDNHLLAAVKPPNLPVQADSSHDADFLSILKKYIAVEYKKPGDAYLGLVHRLDRPVGGAMVFARTSKAAARLSAQFAGHTVDKRYLAVLEGSLKSETEFADHVVWDERAGKTRVVAEGVDGAKEARLISRPLCERDGLTLAEVRLLTGRKHQIRASHANAGLPLWGDARYGRGKPGMQIALWARSLAIEHPTLKTRLQFTSLPPREGAWRVFYDIIETCGGVE